MKKLVVGILAHVDAGKTTLSEGMLYLNGDIRKLGRVDNKDAFLDTYALERERGITIFSKQAILEFSDTVITLLDTPGHVDFSAEMERTLQVLDYAILVISGADGVQAHTQTLWRLLNKYNIPVFLFINKMDQDGTDKAVILHELKRKLSDSCCEFNDDLKQETLETIAMCEEDLLEEYLTSGVVTQEEIKRFILERKVFPCYFGSALKLQGVDTFLRGLCKYTYEFEYPQEFGAKVFKIIRDEQGNRLTYMKITGGSLQVKMSVTNSQEKINQLRVYSGTKYEPINTVDAGSICAVTGLSDTYIGQGLGIERASEAPLLTPVLTYQVQLPTECDPAVLLPKLMLLEEEDPELHIVWKEELQEIHACLMGEVQTEVLKRLVKERFGYDIGFGSGSIVYRETIADTVEGIGHFEPLRHYAEVHLLLEPGKPGSGLQFESECSEDNLDRNWQRLILTHLMEKEHKGVLTGSAITDMKITLVNGRAHIKHTEGGDFRQATYRAVRQGLMKANSVLLEPYYEFRLEIPEQTIGRAMTDIEKMNGSISSPQIEHGFAVLTGNAPVVLMQNYQKEVVAYTKGHGRLTYSLKGYEPCHNTKEIMNQMGYDPESDLANPTGSVFCAHGAGFVVPWDQVQDYMHLEATLQNKSIMSEKAVMNSKTEEYWMGVDEIDAILNRTFNANKKPEFIPHKGISNKRPKIDYVPATRVYKKTEYEKEYLLVDGYNVIFANEELKELADLNMDSAKGKLQDMLCNYQAIKKCEIILVFDAYRVQGHPTEFMDYHNIHIVYTKEAETADQYIEKFAHENSHKYQVVVATSDGLEQVIIRSKGCQLLSSRDLIKEIHRVSKQNHEAYLQKAESQKNYLFDTATEQVAKQVEKIRQGKSIL